MKIRYTRQALAELSETLAYIERNSPSGAERVLRRIRSTTEQLRYFPRSGSLTDLKGIRKINAAPYPYIVLYEVAGDEVIVHSVRHAARKDAARFEPDA